MSAQPSSPSKNRSLADNAYPYLEVVKLTPKWCGALEQFFQDLQASGDETFFSPHPSDLESLRRISTYNGKDLYYLLVEKQNVIGYGMLRGWDEDYQIPSLGLAIHPSARGGGLGKMLICFLHQMAYRRGADNVRLRVHVNNEIALKLYKSFGYVFKDDTNQVGFLIGIKNFERK